MIDTVSLVAVEYPPAKAARHVLEMLSARDGAPSEEQRQAMRKGGNTVAVDPKQLLTQYDCNITGHEKSRNIPETILKNFGMASSQLDATLMGEVAAKPWY